MAATAPPDDSSGPPAAPAVKLRRRRRWPGVLVALLALLALLPVVLWWGLQTQPASLPWLLAQVPGLQVQGLDGTLAGGRLQVRQLVWQAPAGPSGAASGRLEVQGLRLTLQPPAWRPFPGAWVHLHLPTVQADRVIWRSASGPGAALQAPADLRLPLTLQIDQLAIGELLVDDQPPATALTARLALGLDRGERHRLDALSLVWQGSGLAAQGQIDSAGAMPVQALLAAQRNGARPWAAQLQLQGPIRQLQAQLQLAGSPLPGRAPAARPALSARAELRPFEPWPLGALTLSTRQLDLATLLPAWPHTDLSGEAEVQTQGLDQPATARVRLDNRLPGAWDAQRVPVARLVLTGRATPNQPDQLTIEQFSLDLAGADGPAGRVAGQGRWQGGELALDTTVTGLLPARLHRQAAALQLGGPLQLTLAGLGSAAGPGSTVRGGLTTQLSTRLTGRTLDRAALPVSLTLVGQFSGQHIQVTEARLASGPASAQATLDAQQGNAGWRLQGKAALSRFDPLPWWRGADGSAWQRGPHRLDAQADFQLLWRNAPSSVNSASSANTPRTPRSPANPDATPLPPELERWLAVLEGDARLQVQDSLLAGLPLSGQARLQRAGAGTRLDSQLDLAGNRAVLQAERAALAADDQWRLQLQAPALAALAPLAPLLAADQPALGSQWPTAGALQADVSARGRWPAWRTDGTLQADGWRAGSRALQSAKLTWTTGASADAPLAVQLQAKGLADGEQRLDSLSASLSGNLRQHRLDLQLDSPAKPPAWTENLLGPAGTGTHLQLSGQGQWLGSGGGAALPGTWRLQGLQLQGGTRDRQGGSRPWLAAQDLGADVQLGPQAQVLALRLAPGRVQLLDTALRWQDAQWSAAAAGRPAQLHLVAELERFDVAALLARAQPGIGWGGKLIVGGRFDVHSTGRFDADLVLERLAGDLTLTDDLGSTQALGITDLRLALSAHDGLWQFAQGAAGRSLGEMAGAQVLRTSADRLFPPPDAPLQGVVEARVANLGIWGTWVPPGWRLAGQLRTSASFGGTRGAPEVRGEMVGSGLGLRNLLQGVNFSDGDLALTLQGETARIERFRFKGGDGQLSVSGQATLGARPGATLSLQAERFRLLGRIDRRLVASGQADLRLDAQQLRLDGAFTVDEGLIDLSRADAPALDADVQVRRNGQAAPAAAEPTLAAALPAPLRQPQVRLKIGLGTQLRLRGHGIDTGLRGDLAVTSPDGHLALHGTVRAEGGSVAAYGQKLEIDRGAVTFSGALDNPALDVLAIRPNLDVRVGVQVSGLAQRPRIRLVSEPELPDYDKLSWLVLGRSPDGLGRTDTALLQRAALALLSGEGRSPGDALLESVGLTDFSVRQSDGDTRETIVSLGKQLSRRWYLGYERSVNATTGTWQLIYRIAQRFTLRAQSGTDNAVDVIWSWRW